MWDRCPKETSSVKSPGEEEVLIVRILPEDLADLSTSGKTSYLDAFASRPYTYLELPRVEFQLAKMCTGQANHI
jgi:hypothetical protein